jgi:hypothetical protein
MLCYVALVRTDVSEKGSTSIIRMTRIGNLGTTLTVTSNQRMLLVTANVPSSPVLVTLMMEALRSSETLAVNSNRHTLLVTATVPNSPILVTLMMEALRSSESSILTRATLRNILEDGILHV